MDRIQADIKYTPRLSKSFADRSRAKAVDLIVSGRPAAVWGLIFDEGPERLTKCEPVPFPPARLCPETEGA